MTSCARLLLFAAALVVPSAGFDQPMAASQAAESFYAHYQKLKVSGLPAAKESAQLAPHLSKGLQVLLRKAKAEQARCMKAEPDDKGPWVEGDLFTSNFEGFTKFKVMAGTGGRFAVQFGYTENGQTFAWQDEVGMTNEGGRWVVDDVFYRRTTGFTSGFGASLRTSLSELGCPLAAAKR